MGLVYEAFRIDTELRAAVKILPRSPGARFASYTALQTAIDAVDAGLAARSRRTPHRLW
jgi:hypothetical protein